MTKPIAQLSVIVPVGERQSPPDILFGDYKRGLDAIGLPYEIIFVLDGPHPVYERELLSLANAGQAITVVSLSRPFGDATAIMVGFDHAVGGQIVILPAYLQVDGSQIAALIAPLDTADLAVGCREPRATRWYQSVRRAAFHTILRSVTRLSFRDLGCNARAMRRKVLEEIRLYGDQQRFLPVLAERQGFRVIEVSVRQSANDRHRKSHPARNYMHAFLDIFTIFFLVRFTKKPLRFFGMIGVATLSIGMIELLYLVLDRVAFSKPLADRPALLLASLLIVLGVQIFALGLLGELIIFTHAGGNKDYQIDRVSQYSEAAPTPVKGSVSVKVVARG